MNKGTEQKLAARHSLLNQLKYYRLFRIFQMTFLDWVVVRKMLL
ncbi:hypothetical protein I619_08357 [Listeria monocytogenes SHL010]|nr:hypothetical protein I619_08357 [Listeria monocytogenes SHL010]